MILFFIPKDEGMNYTYNSYVYIGNIEKEIVLLFIKEQQKNRVLMHY